MKPAFWSSLFLSVSVPALAAALPMAPSAQLTNWQVSTIKTDSAAYCAMVTQYPNAPILTFTRNVAGKGSVALDFKNARLEKDRAYAVTIGVDGKNQTYAATALNTTTLVVQLGADNPLFAAMSNGKDMSVSLDGTKGVYALAGNAKAFGELSNCVVSLNPVPVTAVAPVVAVAAPAPVTQPAPAMVEEPELYAPRDVALADTAPIIWSSEPVDLPAPSMKIDAPIKTVTILWDNPLHPNEPLAGFALSESEQVTADLNAKQLATIKKTAPPTPAKPAPALSAPIAPPATLSLKEKLAQARAQAQGNAVPLAEPAQPVATAPAPLVMPEPVQAAPAPVELSSPPLPVPAEPSIDLPVADTPMAPKTEREISSLIDPFNEPGQTPAQKSAPMDNSLPTVNSAVPSPDANIHSYLFDDGVTTSAFSAVPRVDTSKPYTPKIATTTKTKPAKAMPDRMTTPAQPVIAAPKIEPVKPVATASLPEPLPLPPSEPAPPVMAVTELPPAAPAKPAPAPALMPVAPVAMPATAPVSSQQATSIVPVRPPTRSVAFQPAPVMAKGNWVVRSIAAAGNSQMPFCLLENRFENDTRLMIGQRADGHSTIGVNYGIDMLEANKNYVVTVQLDNDFEENFSGYAESPHTLVVQMGKKPSFFSTIIGARALRVAMPGVASSFQLGTITQRFDEFSQCLQTIGGMALSPAASLARRDDAVDDMTAVPIAPVTSETLAGNTPINTVSDAQSQKGSLSNRVSSLLRKAAVKPYRYAATQNDASWTDASGKMTARATMMSQGEVADAAKAALETAAKACSGTFNSQVGPVDAGMGTTIQTMESKCVTGDAVAVSTWLVEKDAASVMAYELQAPRDQRSIAFSMRTKLLQALKSSGNN